MREPLLIPFLCIAAGVALGQALDFGVPDSAWPAFAFCALSAISPSPRLRQFSLFLSLVFVGTFLVALHRPSKIPVLDVPSREIAVAEGCVVQPTVLSNDRAQFVLELEPGAPDLLPLAVPEDTGDGLRAFGNRGVRVIGPASMERRVPVIAFEMSSTSTIETMPSQNDGVAMPPMATPGGTGSSAESSELLNGSRPILSLVVPSGKIASASVSRTAAASQVGHLVCFQVGWRSRGLPGLSKVTSSGSVTGSWFFGPGTMPQAVQWMTGIPTLKHYSDSSRG